MGMTARIFAAAAVLLSLAAAPSVHAEEARIGIELNKLEPTEKGCRSYIVVRNPADQTFTAFNMEVLVFDTDGVIQNRIAMDLAPIQPNKTSVLIVNLAGNQCDRIGEVLVNSFLDCERGDERLGDCLARIDLSSKADARLFK
ncbi:MAG: Tat pathway signal protein [Thalassobaculaceae bacterium]|nr:Tat pathway signal protein [Thalassobaculaceae bacterium]